MKSIYSFVSALLIGGSALAQVGQIAHDPIVVGTKADILAGSSFQVALDTLEPPSFGSPFFCDSVLYCYDFDYATPVDTGYVFGTSKYKGTECAQAYNSSGSVSEVLVLYGAVAGTAGQTNARVYFLDPTSKKPAGVMANSPVITTGNITKNVLTKYTFSTPVAVTGKFAVGVVFPVTLQDTVGVSSTAVYCSSGDTLSFINFPNFGGWNTCPGAYSVPYDPTANLDLVILPVMITTAGVNELPYADGMTLKGAFPSPAQKFTQIRFDMERSAEVKLEIYTLDGRLHYKSAKAVGSGENFFDIDLSQMAAGNYYYSIKTDKGILTSKFNVVK